MSLCNTYRSFAIYLIIVTLISESPVSAFTIRRTRTTTLPSIDQDLAADASALLEVKSELSKLNNEKDYVKFGTRKYPIKKPANIIRVDKKIASGGNTNVILPTTVNLPNEKSDITKLSDDKMILKDTYTTPYYFIGKPDGFRVRGESTTDISIKTNVSLSNETLPQNVTAPTNMSGSEETATSGTVTDPKDKSQNIDDEFSSTSTECSEEYSSETEETQNTKNVITTLKPAEETPTVVTENNNDTTTNAGTASEEIIIYKVIRKSTLPQSTTATIGTDSTKLNESENVSTVTDSKLITEVMVGESSKSSTNDPSWKKYTLIERRRNNQTTETENPITKAAEELEKAESISSKVTLEDTSSSTATSNDHQDLESDIKTTSQDIDDLNSSSTSQAYNNVPETETQRLPATQPLSAETTTEERSRDSLASRRAGYLDLSAKQDVNEAATTEQLEEIRFNETELLGSIFEIETQDNDGLEIQNSTRAESQSQLADDAIKEELMKEAVLSDHEENSKRYSEEHQDINKVKTYDTNADDSLSVKPIGQGKGALYTTRSNYKPMKKIEVQSLKPYVRDPDDNSWRNESLSYLGIVFKAKNASKPFTQVLKNKTEAELNNWTERETKNEVPDLRERLEKIAEVRKSKKKKLNQFGEMVYTDYEENSSETSSTSKTDKLSAPGIDVEELYVDRPQTTPSVKTESASQRTTTPGVYMYKEETTTTIKPKKANNFAEYYDTTDEDDVDYLSLSKIDLKKFTTRLFGGGKDTTRTTPPPLTMLTKPMKTMLPDRQPTVQYFPPRGPPRREPPHREPQKVNFNDYDTEFQKKVNMFAYSEPPKLSSGFLPTLPPATMDYKTTQYLRETSVVPGPARQYKPGNPAKNVYDTFPPRTLEHGNRFPASNDEGFNRASYVIKHFKDLIDEAVKDDYDKSAEFIQPYTEAPPAGVPLGEPRDPTRAHIDVDYDYDANFRKEILSKFVDNFNQNSERFKVDFPILYNSSVVHMQGDENGRVVASSSAFLKRQYGAAGKEAAGRACCAARVDLSPAYELHYYVPDQEEKQEAEKPMPFSVRL